MHMVICEFLSQRYGMYVGKQCMSMCCYNKWGSMKYSYILSHTVSLTGGTTWNKETAGRSCHLFKHGNTEEEKSWSWAKEGCI